MKSPIYILSMAAALGSMPSMQIINHKPLMQSPSYNQRKARKARRARHAAGDRKAFK